MKDIMFEPANAVLRIFRARVILKSVTVGGVGNKAGWLGLGDDYMQHFSLVLLI